jgi:hypothetical protein
MRSIWGVVALVAASGCITTSSVQRAETLGKGNFEIGVEPGFEAVVVTNNTQVGNSYLPTSNFTARFGAGDKFDIGGRIGTGLLELMMKFMITDPSNEAFALSLAPSIEGFGFGAGSGGTAAAAGFLNIALPVLVGFKFGAHELVLGPRVNNFLVFASASGSGSALIYSLVPGVSVGFAAHITDIFEIHPEVSIGVPVAVAATANNGVQNSGGAAGTAGNGVIFNVVVGFKFGRLTRKPAQQQPQELPPPPLPDAPPTPAPEPIVPPPPPPPPPPGA